MPSEFKIAAAQPETEASGVTAGVTSTQPVEDSTAPSVSLSIFPPIEQSSDAGALVEQPKIARETEPIRAAKPDSQLLHHADQAIVAVIVAAALVAIVAYCVQQGGLRGRLIEIEHAAPARVAFKVDINTADATEISQMPELGETLAQRIVAAREANGPFHSADDLMRVKGIGLRKMDQLRPYIAPIEAADAPSEPAPLVSSPKAIRKTPAKPKKPKLETTSSP